MNNDMKKLKIRKRIIKIFGMVIQKTVGMVIQKNSWNGNSKNSQTINRVQSYFTFLTRKIYFCVTNNASSLIFDI